MKKLLGIVVLSFFLIGNTYAYKSIKILDKIDLTIDADTQTVLTSIKNYNGNAVCEISITKKGDYTPTTERFSVGDNLNELYDLFRKYKKPISIYCPDFTYKFKNKNNNYGVLDKKISLRFSLCKNKITEIETVSYLDIPVYGNNPVILRKWVSLFKNYSNKSPRKEPKEYGVRNVWVDIIFEDKTSKIQYSIIQGLHSNGLGFYQVRIIDLNKYSRCYLN